MTKKLPPMFSATSNRGLSVAWLEAILGGLTLFTIPAIMLARWLFGQWFEPSYTIFSTLIWLLLIAGSWLVAQSIDRFNTDTTYRKLVPQLIGAELPIEKHAELLNLSVPQLLEEISKMKLRGYWQEATILDNALVLSIATYQQQISFKIFTGENMRFIPQLQGYKIPQITVIFLLTSILKVSLANFHFPLIVWFLVAIALSFPFARLFPKFLPKRRYIMYDKIPEYVPQSIELTLSGDEQADQLIAEAETYLTQLKDLEYRIPNTHLNGRIKELYNGTHQMVEEIRKTPKKYKLARQTMTYSLPTAINLLYKYIELEAQPIKGENITRSIQKIHEMSDFITHTFQKELDAMYQDQTIDIEVDIEVMKNMLSDEKLDIKIADLPANQ